jgi:hypothetical protein
MSILNIILVFLSIFISILFWRQNNKVALIISIIFTILIVIFHKQVTFLLDKHIILPGFSTINLVDEMEINIKASPFISSKWQDSSLTHLDKSIRIGMVKDFIIRYKPYKKSKDEIFRLLGKPDYNSQLKDWDLAYWLGEEEKLLGSSSLWFVIDFDSTGLVSEFHTIRI